MRNTITLIHRVEGTNGDPDTFTTTYLKADYKITKQSTVSGNDISFFEAMIFLLPFGDYVIEQGDYIVVGEVSNITSEDLIDVLEDNESYDIRSIEEVENKYGVNYQYKVTGV